MIDKTLILFNCVPGSGSTTAANFTELPVISITHSVKTFCIKYFSLDSDSFSTSKIDKYIVSDDDTNIRFYTEKFIKDIENSKEKDIDNKDYVIDIINALLSHQKLFGERGLDTVVTRIKEVDKYLTPRRILFIIEEYVRQIEPLFYAKQLCFDCDLFKAASAISVTDVKTNEEVQYLQEHFKRIYVLEIIRPTMANGPNHRYVLDHMHITKKIFNSKDKDFGSFREKIREFLEDQCIKP